jgi:hypothetical protein
LSAAWLRFRARDGFDLVPCADRAIGAERGDLKSACYESSMNGREFWALEKISDEQLEAGLGKLLGAGARLEARIIAHLAEVDARRWHLRVGCSSLYDYCRRRLGLSDYEAFVRIAAARVARQYPVVFEMLDRRELHLTAICEVREFLTRENHGELLSEVSGKTKLQIREVLARRFPQADLPATLKKLPAFDPLSPGRYRLLLTFSAEQKAKLELARDLLSHANPEGDLAVVLERALDLLISRLERRRFGKTKNPANGGSCSARLPDAAELASDTVLFDLNAVALKQMPMLEKTSMLEKMPMLEKPPTHAHGRKHIRHSVRRQVLARHGARCAFVGDDGTRCDARGFLQFHHRQPWARGGPDTTDNLAVLCHAHNRLLAERDFGKEHVDQFRASRASPRSSWRK